jgi:hypothetical protein
MISFTKVQRGSPRLMRQTRLAALRNGWKPRGKKSRPPNGRARLEEAIAMLFQSEAAFVARLAETDRQHLQFERETAERFARIEAQMAEIIRVLNEHGRLLAEHGHQLERLTEAIREKIGFKGQP